MTTSFRSPAVDAPPSRGVPDVRPETPPRPRGLGKRGPGLLARNPAWPITALLVGYPAWWALGLADYTWVFLAVPMTARMIGWHRYGNRPIRVPPGFGVWLLFLVCSAAGVFLLTQTAPGTVPSAVSHRIISFAVRDLNYVGVTVLLLYAGNLTERELPRRRFAWMLGLVGVYTVIGGLAAIAAPHFQFNSPFELLLPKSVDANPFIQASMHPGLAQIQSVLGTPGGRPKAPFDYTNLWGDCLTILVPWLLVGWTGRSRRQRWIAIAVIVAGCAPLLYSLNRGVWLGALLSLVYLAVRFAARGRMAMIGWVLTVISVAVILVLVTPLHTLVGGRLSTGGSANLRSNLSTLAIRDAAASPIVGFGDTRQERGSPTSIAVGPSPKCPSCGQLAVGSTGQLWLLFVCNGFVGAALYLGFFGYGIWRFRRDRTPYGLAGELVLLLSFLYMFTYDAVGAPLGFTVLAYALLWKNHMLGAPERLAGEGLPAARPHGLPAGSTRLLAPRAPSRPRPGFERRWSGPAGRRPPVSRSPRRRTDEPGTLPGRPGTPRPPGQASRTGLAEVARGGMLNLGGAGFSATATLVITVLVTRHFSRSVAGAFFAATSLFLIVETISNLGAFNGAIYFIARLRSLHEDARIPAIMRAAIRPVTVCSVVAAVATVVFAEPLARLLLGGHASQGVDPVAVARILRALAVTLPFAALADTFLGASRGYRDMLPTVLVDRIGRSSLQLAGVATAILLGGGALLAPLWALPYVPAGVVSWWWLRRIRRRDALAVVAAPPPAAAAPDDKPADLIEDRPGQDVVAAGAREFWRFTGPRALASAAQILIQRLDIVLVGIIRGPAEAAVYTAATRFLVVGQLANVAIGMAAQPQFTHLFAIRDRIAANTVYQVTTSWLVVLTWPLYLLTVIYGPAVLAVFGHSYQVGGPVMVILGLSMLVNGACGQVDVVLTTTGRTTWSLANGLLAVAVNASVDLALIPRYGIIGAAIGWAAAIGVMNLVPLVQVATVIRVHPFGRGSLVACLLSLLSFGAIPLAARAIAGDSAPTTVAAVTTGCLVMLAGLWLGRNVLQLPLLPGAARTRRRSSTDLQ